MEQLFGTKAGGAATSSQYFGVSWHRVSKRWAVQIRHEGKRHHIGYFDSEEDAAKAYDESAVRLRGPGVKTNFAQAGGASAAGSVATHPPGLRHGCCASEASSISLSLPGSRPRSYSSDTGTLSGSCRRSPMHWGAGEQEAEEAEAGWCARRSKRARTLTPHGSSAATTAAAAVVAAAATAAAAAAAVVEREWAQQGSACCASATSGSLGCGAPSCSTTSHSLALLLGVVRGSVVEDVEDGGGGASGAAHGAGEAGEAGEVESLLLSLRGTQRPRLLLPASGLAGGASSIASFFPTSPTLRAGSGCGRQQQ